MAKIISNESFDVRFQTPTMLDGSDVINILAERIDAYVFPLGGYWMNGADS